MDPDNSRDYTETRFKIPCRNLSVCQGFRSECVLRLFAAPKGACGKYMNSTVLEVVKDPQTVQLVFLEYEKKL